MCLEKPSDFKIHHNVGWKVVSETCNKSKYRAPYRDTLLKKRGWNLDKSGAYLFYWTRNSDGYQTGYHIYLLKKDAEYNCGFGRMAKKVQFYEVVAKGFQSNRRVVVARKMRFID